MPRYKDEPHDNKQSHAITTKTRQKRAARKKAPPKEKRQARYRSRTTVKIDERINRAMPGSGHRLFLIDRNTIRPLDHTSGPAASFTVLGATGNVYTVTLDHIPTCSCPDFLNNGGPCKHMLFVTLRVLGTPRTCLHIVQRALLTSELCELLGSGASSTADTSALASDAVRQTWAGMASASSDAQPVAPRGLEDGSECAICFEPLNASTCRTCASCRNGLHVDCLQRLAAYAKGGAVSCPYCRGAFDSGEASGAYVNLAVVSPSHRDVSLADLYGERARWISN